MNEAENTSAVSTATNPPSRSVTMPAQDSGGAHSPSSARYRDGPPKTATGIHSEHGHHLSRIRPLAKHTGTSVATFFNGLFTTVIAIATLGVSITFSYILSNTTSPPPNNSRYDAETVQLFLAISWLLFLLVLATAAFGSTLLTFFRKHWVRDWDGEHGKLSQLTVQLYAVGISTIMGALIVTAFIFMCLIVVAYQAVVGWISLGFTSIFGICVVFSIYNQVPWPWIQPLVPIVEQDEKDSLA